MTIKLLKQARAALEEHNVQIKLLADSGDAGNWKAEELSEYKQAEEVIKAIDDYLVKVAARKEIRNA